MLAARVPSPFRPLRLEIGASFAALALLTATAPCEANELIARVDSPRVRFGLSGTQGIAIVGRGNRYLANPEFVAVHARLGVQFNDHVAAFATVGGSPVPWFYSYDAGVMIEWTPRPFVAFGTGASLHGFPINDAASHAIAAPVAVSFMPWHSWGNRHPAFTVTLSVAPGITVYMPTDSCLCTSATVRENGFTFVSRLEVGFDLR